ncbi:uncharacterized protein LOC115921677 [Strongylocentrotus purpuratus]|uniref:Uncharacterized protein n=1 Tax=Strongylocentrotus purpuratus TaxID=7668 RepID=A0A7M7NEY2_STRPU|nr:uncharacterized protein LOC115921677 [Strongylocentrotus purpuratus]
MEKHRPIWARGLTATELDQRQEQARVKNHGHQVLLESKLGKLDLREKRSVKDIRRKTENMLELLQNIQSSTPRLGPVERPGSTMTSGGLRDPTPQPVDKARLMPLGHVWEESSSSGGSPEYDDDSTSSRTSAPDFHLPRLNPSNPATPKFNTRRRFSANDALAQSLKRFNAYKSNLGRFPSTEAVDENDNVVVRPSSTSKQSRRNSQQRLHVEDDEVNCVGSRSLCSSRRDLESFSSQGDEQSSRVCFRCQSGISSLRQVSEGVTVEGGIRKAEDNQASPNDEIDAINSANKNSSTAPSISRSLSVLAPEFLPIIRAQTRSGKRPDKEDDHENDDDDVNDDVGDVSIVVPFHHKTERSLNMARRQSLAMKPATFRNLDIRRKSSPDVLASTITLNQRVLLRSRQMPTKSLPTSPRWNRSDNVDLQLKIKNFLDKTDSFIQSGERSQREDE